MKSKNFSKGIFYFSIAILSFILFCSTISALTTCYRTDGASSGTNVLGLRLRSFGNTGGQEVFLGVPDLGKASQRSYQDFIDWNFDGKPEYYNWPQYNAVTFTYTPALDMIFVQVNDLTPITYTSVSSKVIQFKQGATNEVYAESLLSNLDMLTLNVVERESTLSTVNVRSLLINGIPTDSDYLSSHGMWKSWSFKGLDYSRGFTISFVAEISGKFGLSQEASKIEIDAGVSGNPDKCVVCEETAGKPACGAGEGETCGGKVKAGGACETAKDCDAGNCVNMGGAANECTANARQGSSLCMKDTDCKSGKCLLVENGRVCAILEEGESCEVDSVCKTNNCQGCVCTCNTYLCKCSRNSNCLPTENGKDEGECIKNKCAPGPGSAKCETHYDCKSGNCIEGRCTDRVELSEGCSHDSDCKSEMCITDVDAEGNAVKVCGKLDVGEACKRADVSYDSLCKSNNCFNGKCESNKPESPCTADQNCLSGKCTNGKCEYSEVYDPCEIAKDCYASNCIDRTCTKDAGVQDCDRPSDCRTGKCEKINPNSPRPQCIPAEYGESCDTHTMCKDKNCFKLKCSCNWADLACKCTDNADCITDNCAFSAGLKYNTCAPGRPGSKCSGRNTDCEGSVCINNICNILSGIDGKCYRDADCLSNDCDVAKTKCRPGKTGANCIKDNDCLSQNCPAKIYQCGKGGAGVLCLENSDCMSDDCDRPDVNLYGECKQGIVGKECKVHADCINRNCNNGICNKGKAGDVCRANEECHSGICEKAAGKENGECLRGWAGAYCGKRIPTINPDSECISDYCRGDEKCGLGGFGKLCRGKDDCLGQRCVNGKCGKTGASKLNPLPCMTNSDCISEVCFRKDKFDEYGICGWAGKGSKCLSAEDCYTNVCDIPAGQEVGVCGAGQAGAYCKNHEDCVSANCDKDKGKCK